MAAPAALAARPHHGELPIPFITAVVDGKPDFRVHDNERRDRCAAEHLCQLCGIALRERFAFVGTRSSTRRRTFGEPPMHLDCMDWAWQVCPWLSGRDFRPGLSLSLTVSHKAAPPRDRFMAIYITDGYRVQPDAASGSIIWIAEPAVEVIAFRERA